MNVIFWIFPDQEGRHFTGSGTKEHEFWKIQKDLLKVGPFIRAQKLRGVVIKCRQGNTIFTKMNLLQNVLIDLLERPMDIHIYVHVT